MKTICASPTRKNRRDINLDHNISVLRNLLAGPLPGKSIQGIMSPIKGDLEMYYQIPENARLAAVLTLLAAKNDAWHLILIRRPFHPKDLHSGQISFPGGGVERADNSFEECALRETYEEIGIPQNSVTIVGSLTKLYVYASNNLVYPYVGYIHEPYDFILDRQEVDKIIMVPLEYFDNPEIVKTTELKIRGYTLKSVPYYDVCGEVLWGATAMIISELLYLWKQIK